MGQMPDATERSRIAHATGQHPSGRRTSRWWQWALAAVAALALAALLVVIGLQVAATQPSSAPARIVHTQAGPYPLTVSLYKDPADAGFALPFAISPSQPVAGRLTYTVMSVPGPGVDATPVNGSIGPDLGVPNGVKGTVEITVRGIWFLRIVVDGPSGTGVASVPITAKPSVVIPVWIAWPIGLIPAVGLVLFFLAQRRRQEEAALADAG